LIPHQVALFLFFFGDFSVEMAGFSFIGDIKNSDPCVALTAETKLK